MACWSTTVVLALEKLSWEKHDQSSVGYTGRPYFKKQTQQQNPRRQITRKKKKKAILSIIFFKRQ
jgi:uncharacterized membrane protein YbaN (DUF454 family)